MVLLADEPVNDLIQEALILRDMGLSVFPIGADKKPLCKWGHYSKRKPSDKEICKKFTSVPTVGIGCVCGAVGGPTATHVVRDFDTHNSYTEWAASYPEMARTCPTVSTRRGHHVHVRIPHPVRWQKLDHGELISDGHYVVLPPSRIKNGSGAEHVYEWLGTPPFSSAHFPVVSLENTGFLPCSDPAQKESQDKTRNTPTTYATNHPLLDPSQLSELVREAARKTQPRKPGTRNYQIGRFARALLDVYPQSTPPNQIYQAFCYWFQLAEPVIETKSFETSFRDFRGFWAKTEVSMRNSLPLRTAQAAADRGTNRTGSLINACAALAALSPDGTFFVSGRTAGEILRVCKMTGARELTRLVDLGHLEIVEKGIRDASLRIATRFRLRE